MHSQYFSPSSLSRRIACPGSAFLEDGIVEEGPKPAADWGTYAHEIAADYLIMQTKPSTWLGKKNYGQICNQEMVDCVKQYLKDLDELRALAPGAMEHVEKQVSLEWAGYKDVFGTTDFALDKLFETLVICDFKSGTAPVVPKDNAQLYTYALMTAGDALPSYNSIIIAVSQPRSKAGGSSLETYEIDPYELLRWFEHELKPVIKEIQTGNGKLVPGETQCKWCKATNVCPAYTRMATELATVDFANTVPVQPVINDALVHKVYPHLPMLKDWIKKVEGHAFDMAKSGQLNGHKLVAGRRARAWKSEVAATRVLIDHGIEPFEKKLLSPAKAEQALGKDKKVLQELIAVSDGSPVIAPVGDKRKAISTAETDFAQITS